MAKPATLPRWAETAAGAASVEIVQPNSARKDVGFSNTAGDVPTGGEFNWLLNTILAWCKYLDGLAGEAFAWTLRHTFSAGITIPIGQVDADTAGANRKYVTDAVAAEAVARGVSEGALDVRIDALEALDHEGRITGLETNASPLVGELVPAFTNVGALSDSLGRPCALVKVNGIVTMTSGFHNLTIGPGTIKPAGTVLGNIPADFRRANWPVDTFLVGVLSDGATVASVVVTMHSNGDLLLPNDAMPIESVVAINGSWYAGP